MSIDELLQLIRTRSNLAQLRKRLVQVEKKHPGMYEAVCEFYRGVKPKPTPHAKP
jgi:BMFP domain-containing protein YqiC